MQAVNLPTCAASGLSPVKGVNLSARPACGAFRPARSPATAQPCGLCRPRSRPVCGLWRSRPSVRRVARPDVRRVLCRLPCALCRAGCRANVRPVARSVRPDLRRRRNLAPCAVRVRGPFAACGVRACSSGALSVPTCAAFCAACRAPCAVPDVRQYFAATVRRVRLMPPDNRRNRAAQPCARSRGASVRPVTCEGREPVGASGPWRVPSGPISGDGATARPVPYTFAACSPPVAIAPVRPARCPSRRAARPVPLAVRLVPCRMSAQHRAAQPCARSRGAFVLLQNQPCFFRVGA